MFLTFLSEGAAGRSVTDTGSIKRGDKMPIRGEFFLLVTRDVAVTVQRGEVRYCMGGRRLCTACPNIYHNTICGQCSISMRLINVEDEHRMFFAEFNESEIPKYAILSHTWEEEEISYVDACASFSVYRSYSDCLKAGYRKVKRFAAVAREMGLGYIWVDTYKSSSAELSEAINSMYRWYRNSTSCCIYLSDVPDQPEKYWFRPAEKLKFTQAVKDSRWLTRGWTLQELLAPRKRFFYSRNWQGGL